MRKKTHSGDIKEILAFDDRIQRQKDFQKEQAEIGRRKGGARIRANSDSDSVPIAQASHAFKGFAQRLSALGILTSEGERSFSIGLSEDDRRWLADFLEAEKARLEGRSFRRPLVQQRDRRVVNDEVERVEELEVELEANG